MEIPLQSSEQTKNGNPCETHQTPWDRLAAEHGVDGIVVSDHGGRAEESGRGTIESLPEVIEGMAGRIPVLIDGGFGRGTDIFKALALGASCGVHWKALRVEHRRLRSARGRGGAGDSATRADDDDASGRNRQRRGHTSRVRHRPRQVTHVFV